MVTFIHRAELIIFQCVFGGNLNACTKQLKNCYFHLKQKLKFQCLLADEDGLITNKGGFEHENNRPQSIQEGRAVSKSPH